MTDYNETPGLIQIPRRKEGQAKLRCQHNRVEEHRTTSAGRGKHKKIVMVFADTSIHQIVGRLNLMIQVLLTRRMPPA